MNFIAKWKKFVRGTNTFQMIMFAILFHSLASIFAIYIHLMWFFADEERSWKHAEDVIVLNKGNIVWNKLYLRNALSSKVIAGNELSLIGWWMDHARWDVDIRCFNHKWTICSRGFSTNCKADGIRAVYQYVAFAKDAYVDGLEFSLIATADQLEAQVAGATFGALLLIKMNDGTTENVQIQFPLSIEPLTLQHTTFTAEKNKYISSVVVMLMCYGYTGSIHFTDPILLLHAAVSINRQNAVLKCPPKSIGTKSATHGIIRQERIIKAAAATTKTSAENPTSITLVTQLSMDRMGVLERSLRLWDGPVSLVIYIQSKGMEKKDAEWQRLYVQKKLKGLNLQSHSQVTLVFGHSSEKDYPINTLRNIAIKQATTSYVLLVDADFQPSPDFQQRFSSSLKHFPHNSRTVFVAPAFEYIELPQKSDGVPQTKEELLQLLHREDPFILPFRLAESGDSHRITDYWKWYRANKPYVISTFSDKFEPYIVLQKSSNLPLYDERFLGYGMNKVTHITELFASNYSFVVLPDVWVIHLPHKASAYTVEFLQNPRQRLKNRLERFEFLADILQRYKIGHCKNSNPR